MAPDFPVNSWLRIVIFHLFIFGLSLAKRNCSSNVCFNNGICVVDDAAGVFQCECQPGFTGTLCESVLPCLLDCRNGGLCSFDQSNNAKCQCPEGFTGKFCTSNADCFVTGCLEGEICLLDTKKQKWSCAVDFCYRDNPCKNNATCRPIRDGFFCECPIGFGGKSCDVDLDDCSLNSCQNGGTCIDLPGGFRCDCPMGFSGLSCEQKTGYCLQNPCGKRGDCVEEQDGYKCNCHSGFSGKNCETEVPVCVCENDRHECFLINGKPSCKCPEGTQGENCDQSVDFCATQNPCLNGGQCIANGNQTFCICSSQFNGQFCQNRVVECLVDDKPCLNGGKCVKGEFNNNVENKCECIGKFMGKWCEQMRLNAHLNSSLPKECPEKFCGNGGKCHIEKGKPVCECSQDFTGPRCELPVTKNVCFPNPCFNGGECQNDGNSASCFCTETFTGKYCEIACNCDSNQICRESFKTPGAAECLTVPPSEILTPDNGSSEITATATMASITTTTLRIVLETTTQPKQTDFPFPSFLINNFTIQNSQNDISDSTTMTPNNLTTISYIQTLSADYDDLLNVTSCEECANAQRCLNIDKKSVCLCHHDFDGAFCDQPISPCSATSCKNGQVCRLQRTGTSNLAQCACPSGFFGVNCQEPTTASFKNTSVLLYQSPEIPGGNRNKRSPEYSLIFSFRTTLSKVHFVSGENLLGKRQFSIELADGYLVLNVAEVTTTVLDLPLNDGEWYSIWFTSLGNSVSIEVEDSLSGYILTRKKELTRPFSVFTTRFGKIEDGFFVGCLRDAFIGGQIVDLLSDERSLDIEAGCHRREQCSAEKCQNGANCIDLWNDFKCQCIRPYLEPNCVEKLSEVTFGHDNVSSVIEYNIDATDAKEIRQKLDFSFLMRTNAENGLIAFLGNRTENEESIGTFIAVEIIDGKLLFTGRLGGKKLVTFGVDKKVSDNLPHLVEIQKNGNEFRIKVDGKSEGSLNFKQPFEHPMLTDSLVLGSRTSVKQSIFSSKSDYYKGTLQDVRINRKTVFLTDEQPKIELESFGQKMMDQNILPGTISDDVCSAFHPCLHGKCFNTFNDYECQCELGWIDRDCGKKDFCADKPCPGETKCTNTHGGYVCVSSATFSPTSLAKYSIYLPETLITKKQEANFSVEIRTRSKTGQIFKLQSSTDSLSLHLTEKGVDFVYSNSTNLMRDPLAMKFNDGQWHTIILRESFGKLFSEFDSSPLLPLLAPFSLTKFVVDKNARLLIGKGSNLTSFKGCIQNIFIDDLPQLSFLPKDVFGNGFKLIRHFIPISFENMRNNGCKSKEVCGALNPCKNGATCVDHFDLRECKCLRGFEGEFCERNVNDCGPDDDEKCSYSGQCVDGVNEFLCSCFKGFTGDNCENLVDQCINNPCQNDGKCRMETDGTYSCDCPNEFFGSRCQQKRSVQCAARPCENGGTCKESDNGIECVCPPLHRGQLCEDKIDVCSSLPCKNGGTCMAEPDGSFKCHCTSYFTGDDCSQFADFCRQKGEKNAPSCVHGGCRNIWNGFLCQCDEGWTGAHCEIDVNECLEFPCANNGTCINTAGGFKCECAEFHLGNTCDIVGVCATYPCIHGICIQHSATEFNCECEKGFQGKNCEEQIDYCKNEPCKNGATCQKLIGGFNCLCIAGFTGETCLTDIDDCVPNACANSGRCIDRVNGFECNCNSTGYIGAQCTEDVDECSLQLISNYCINGLCQNSPGNYNCHCEEGFIGLKCNMVNPCLPDILNRTLHNCVHGVCRDPVVVTLPSGREVAQHSCECFSGFTGPQCTHEIQKHYAIAFGYILGPVAAILIVLCLLGCMLFFFVARNKRANQGHYSPSIHEQTGNRMQNFSDVHDGSPKITIATTKQTPTRTPDLKLKIRSAPFPPKRQQTDSKPIAVGTTWAFAVHPVDETL